MAGEEIYDDNIDIGDVESMRPRYELVITRHIEMILEDGRFDARAKERTPSKPSGGFPCYEALSNHLFHSLRHPASTKSAKKLRPTWNAEELALKWMRLLMIFSVGYKLNERHLSRALPPRGNSSNDEIDEIDDLEEPDTSGNDGQLAHPR